MRRRWLLLLVAVLISGCTTLKELMPTPERPVYSAGFLAPTPAPTLPPDLSTVARMQARGSLVVGVRYDLEPFSYVTEQGTLAGLEIDLAHELARRWLGDANAVQFIQVRSDTALSHLSNGDVDIVLAGVVHTQNDEAKADFGPTYFVDGQALLTFPDSGIQSVQDAAGRKIAVVGWTGSKAALQAAVTEPISFTVEASFFDALESLRTRQVDAYGDLRHRLERARRYVAGTTTVGQYTQEPIALAYRQNDPFFANLVTLTFIQMAEDGTTDSLYAHWLPGVSPPQSPRWPGTAGPPELSGADQHLATLDVIARIRQRGKLAVGYFVDRWPYSADRSDGKPTGFEVWLVQRLAERWLGSRDAVAFVPIDEASGPQKLSTGEVDMLIGGWIHTREGELQYDYSFTIFDDGVSLLSLANVPVPTVNDLNGRPVGVIAHSLGEQALPALSQAAGVGLASVTYPDLPSAVQGLQHGEVAAIFGQRYPLLDILYHQGGFTLSDARYTYRPVAIVLPQGDSAYHDLVNLTLSALQLDGTYSDLYHLWFDDPIPALPVWPGQPAVPLKIIAGSP